MHTNGTDTDIVEEVAARYADRIIAILNRMRDVLIAAGEAVIIALTNGESAHPYAVWWLRLSDNTCTSGDYCFTLTQAFEAYVARGGR